MQWAYTLLASLRNNGQKIQDKKSQRCSSEPNSMLLSNSAVMTVEQMVLWPVSAELPIKQCQEIGPSFPKENVPVINNITTNLTTYSMWEQLSVQCL